MATKTGNRWAVFGSVMAIFASIAYGCTRDNQQDSGPTSPPSNSVPATPTTDATAAPTP